MTWASWTTAGVYAGKGGVRIEEGGTVRGDLTVHTTWTGDHADVTVQYSGASEWFTLIGSPVSCGSEQESRALHQAVVGAVRAGDDLPVPHSTDTPLRASTVSRSQGRRPRDLP
ncbi:hypothetical protein [Streptomyces sp. JJ36]|uniref:hypothetical protein n=1 Tax=Streptomyces sp. JJ36 TaxID=2736645 RepID=UPI001F2CD6C2|nr:hypothetical protein [Streptomyces sp. JJ36]